MPEIMNIMGNLTSTSVPTVLHKISKNLTHRKVALWLKGEMQKPSRRLCFLYSYHVSNISAQPCLSDDIISMSDVFNAICVSQPGVNVPSDIHHTTENLVIIGDFNFHIESTSSNSKTFNSLIDSFDLTQKVNFPTHIYGHTLDLLLTKSNNNHI